MIIYSPESKSFQLFWLRCDENNLE